LNFVNFDAITTKYRYFGALAMSPSPRLPPSVSHRLELLARRLRDARKQRRWTQERLAKVAGIGVSTVRAIEYGEAATAIGNYLAMLWALDLDAQLDNLLLPGNTTSTGATSPRLDRNI
jgi:DNA-binding XRE family transcriptional regulator